ncbi:unnamed protein product [Ixodes pacificus]
MAPFLIHGVVQHSLRDGLVCHVVYPLYLQTFFFFIKRLSSLVHPSFGVAAGSRFICLKTGQKLVEACFARGFARMKVLKGP